MLAIGLMSGTSLDGVDVCLVEIKKGQFFVKAFVTYPYNESIKEKIMMVSNPTTSRVDLICKLNTMLSYYYIEAIDNLFNNIDYKIDDVYYIAMHGQTIWHNPSEIKEESSTLQIGDPSIISYHYNKTVISNFRMMDMAAGGCGAPLIPYAIYELYHDNLHDIAYQNIGGIGNVTYLPKNKGLDGIIAFDTGPGNMLIDGAMKRLFNKSFDEDGKIAFSGSINKEVLANLLEDDYFAINPPKSTGREKYNDEFLNKVINKILSTGDKEDVITTLTAFTGLSIINQINRYVPLIEKLIVSGGGAHNKYLMKTLQDHLTCKVEKALYVDELEALGFAILGYYTLRQEPTNVPQVTNAKKKVVLGNITNPPQKERL